MTTSSEKVGFGRPVGRYDTWIMATGVVMFLLSFAPWEGLNPETLGNLGGLGGLSGLGNVPVIPGSIYNAWHVGFGAGCRVWLPSPSPVRSQCTTSSACRFRESQGPGRGSCSRRWQR
jgi:hypothetical protein